MAQQKETCQGVAPRQALELHSAEQAERTEVSPAQDWKQDLPLVAEARARDQLARAQLRSAIPRTMAQLEHGKHWQKAKARRTAVFGSPNDGGGAS